MKELHRVERLADPKDVDSVIMSGLTTLYDAEAQMLESSSDWPIEEWTKRAVFNKYECLQSEQSAAGSKVMHTKRGNDRHLNPIP